MTVLLNNENYEIKDDTSILEFLNGLSQISLKGLAIAINNEVVPKTEWVSFILTENDKITLIRATQGG